MLSFQQFKKWKRSRFLAFRQGNLSFATKPFALPNVSDWYVSVRLRGNQMEYADASVVCCVGDRCVVVGTKENMRCGGGSDE